MRSRLPVRLLVASLALATLALTAGPSLADTLVLKDGRIVEGMVVKQDADYLVLSRFGPSLVKAADVREHNKAKPVDEQIREHLAAVPVEDTANRARLATWLKQIGRETEAETIAGAVLELDPESAEAHTVLGHVRHRGAWCTPDEAKRAQGLEKHGDKWFTPDEWKNLGATDKAAAAEKEKQLATQRIGEEVNKALRLVTSPDPLVRARAKKSLQDLAEELDSDPLRELLKNLDAYVDQVDAVRERASEVESSGASGYGTVLGEFRVTVAKLKRPIREFTTNLASGPIGANAPVTLQLPELEVLKVRTTGMVPAVVR